MKIWYCKIGEVGDQALRNESGPLNPDSAMRGVVTEKYEDLTGQPPTFVFSGWAAELTESERAVVEDREPDLSKQLRDHEEHGAVLREAAISAGSASGTDLIIHERHRQVVKRGYNAYHDDRHNEGELLAAAECYVDAAMGQTLSIASAGWPWGETGFKVSADPVRNLVKAGALIAAEIDRIRRYRTKEERNEIERARTQLALDAVTILSPGPDKDKAITALHGRLHNLEYHG